MNKSNISHAFLGMLFQIGIAGILMCFGISFVICVAVGLFFSVGFYFGREVAQAECKLGRDPWWIGFDMRLWSKDGLLDFVLPLISSCLVFLLVYMFW